MIKNISPVIYDTIRLQLLTHATQPVPAGAGLQCENTETLSLETIEHVLGETAKAGCRKLQVVGGDPLLSPVLEATVECAKVHGFEDITILSPLVFLPAQSIEMFQTHAIRMVSWFYSDQPFVHELVTDDLCSWTTIMRHLETCLATELDLKLWIPCLEETQSTLEETVLFLKDNGFDTVQIISEFSVNALLSSRIYDPHLVIQANGDVIFSIKQSNILMGNLHQTALPDLLFPVNKNESEEGQENQQKTL